MYQFERDRQNSGGATARTRTGLTARRTHTDHRTRKINIDDKIPAWRGAAKPGQEMRRWRRRRRQHSTLHCPAINIRSLSLSLSRSLATSVARRLYRRCVFSLPAQTTAPTTAPRSGSECPRRKTPTDHTGKRMWTSLWWGAHHVQPTPRRTIKPFSGPRSSIGPAMFRRTHAIGGRILHYIAMRRRLRRPFLTVAVI